MFRFTQNFQGMFTRNYAFYGHKSSIFLPTHDVILTPCLHVCEIMGFMIEDKHLIKCLPVSSSNEYLILTLIECLITHKHTLKILCKSKHFPPRYNRKREWVFLLSEHQTKTPTRVFFYIVGLEQERTISQNLSKMSYWLYPVEHLKLYMSKILCVKIRTLYPYFKLSKIVAFAPVRLSPFSVGARTH